ncbi:class I SAM-dependent methyltransferase [Novosphingobium sp. JCM 18896]|uniref:class I SAM-dependent methyltransferase n=1 Tax=Novosphingobium sp. JCM 18896 TaxID=2989731 RepID=UPI002221792C|nr:methyltransferase [Novosphingobium sp. JCM 18896]MCW1432205.1 methyltransferase [Novosphingobium sp. JCM 18896]
MTQGSAWVAVSEFVRRPDMVGSAVPASARMVRRMLGPLDWHRIGVLVEYGPGTGRFTFEALKRMRSDATLLAIETGEGFVEALRNSCDDHRLIVVRGTAQDVNRHLAEQGLKKANCILTGLPFSTLEPDEADAIMRESARALSSSGVLAAYQMRRAIRPLLKRHFASLRSSYEWWNIPPCHLYWARGKRLGALMAAR